MHGITYRRALNSDSEAIRNILEATFKEYEIDLPDNYSLSDIYDLEQEYLNAGGEFMVFLRAQNIIGFFALLPCGKNEIEVKRLYLTAGERGKGLGKSILKLALGTAKKSGYHRVNLETTSKFVEAVSLYRKYGFTKNVGIKLQRGHDIGLKIDLGSYNNFI